MRTLPGAVRPMSLAERTVVVTGGSRGIGAAVVRLARQQGARVAVLDLAPTVDADCCVQCDVASADAVGAAFDEVRRSLGPVSALINNAGIAPPGRFEQFTEELWNMTLAVDLTSVFLCTRAALPQLRECGGGSVTNVGSIAGRHRSFTASAAYAAAKGGVVALTRQLAHEFAEDGVRVNCVCPGLVGTDILRQNVADEERAALASAVPLRRLAEPTEVAEVICFLAAETASYVTGAIVARSWADEFDRVGVLTLFGLVPVTGAVDRHFHDAVLGHVGPDHLPAVPALTLVVPALFELDGEPVIGLLHPFDPHLSRERVPLGSHGQDLLGGRGLHAPVRHRQVGEDVGCEQAFWRGTGLEEPDQVRHRHTAIRSHPNARISGGGVGGGVHACAPAPSRFFCTTAIVASRSVVGLNSTTDVPAVTSGR
jgi:NAD(P)-dependent dehydrogenase (short-subunit alcohol dehydrogenase family)